MFRLYCWVTRYYHRIMHRYWKWRVHRTIVQMKEIGRVAGLPSLDGFTDEQIVEGFRQYWTDRADHE